MKVPEIRNLTSKDSWVSRLTGDPGSWWWHTFSVPFLLSLLMERTWGLKPAELGLSHSAVFSQQVSCSSGLCKVKEGCLSFHTESVLRIKQSNGDKSVKCSQMLSHDHFPTNSHTQLWRFLKTNIYQKCGPMQALNAKAILHSSSLEGALSLMREMRINNYKIVLYGRRSLKS